MLRLRRRVATAALGLLMVAGTVVSPSVVQADPSADASCNSGKFCTAEVELPGTGSSSQASDSKGSGGSSGKGNEGMPGKPAGSMPTACKDKWGTTVSCTTKDGAWSTSDNCYWQLQNPQDAPPPGKNAADGAWYVCTTRAGGPIDPLVPIENVQLTSAPVWRDNGQAPPQVIQITPAQAAQRVLKTMKFAPVQTGLSIDVTRSSRWSVGIETWMWIENSKDKTARGPQSVTAEAGGVSVTLDAMLLYVDYDMGDGNKKRCRPTGLRYSTQVGRKPSPDCGYVYEKMSPDEGKGTYRITSTAHWEVSWTGAGQSGVIPMETTSTRGLRVGEIQVLNVPARRG